MSSLLIIPDHAEIKVLLEFGLPWVSVVNYNCHMPPDLDIHPCVEHVLKFIANYHRKLAAGLGTLGSILSLLLTWQGLEEWQNLCGY